jgi:ABC-type branched-subunit amino acid transport system substrate-binding protein
MLPLALILAVIPAAAQETDPEPTIDIGLLAGDPDDPHSPDQAFLQAVSFVVEDWNRRGGLNGQRIRLAVVDRGASAGDAQAALEELLELGIAGMLAPLEPEAREATSKSCSKNGVPVVAIETSDEDELALLTQVLVDKFRTARIGLLSDKSKAARTLQKDLEGALGPAAELVLSEKIDANQKSLEKSFAKNAPDVLVIDAPAVEAAEALRGALAQTSLPIVLTARSVGPLLLGLDRELFAIAGRCASTFETSRFLEFYREERGEPGLGGSEAFELIEILLRAIEAAGSSEPEAVRAAFSTVEYEGPRGSVSVTEGGVLAAPLGLWRLADGTTAPHFPAARPLQELSERTQSREPDPDLGVLFGEPRTEVFRLAKGTQQVFVTFDQGKQSTIDDDLAQLGLFTEGKSPLVDRLVKEELMARMLSMLVPKYLLTSDGSQVPGKSLRISFTANLPSKAKKSKLWTAYIAGADPDADGRTYTGSGYCEIYSTNLRKNKFQAHALEPPIGATDLAYLDGTYTFATDYERDRRTELIRALINGYAGALALVAAHEVGHLCGLDHITGDPLGIMNVEEGEGIDPLDGRFSAGNMELLEKQLGITK